MNSISEAGLGRRGAGRSGGGSRRRARAGPDWGAAARAGWRMWQGSARAVYDDSNEFNFCLASGSIHAGSWPAVPCRCASGSSAPFLICWTVFSPMHAPGCFFDPLKGCIQRFTYLGAFSPALSLLRPSCASGSSVPCQRRQNIFSRLLIPGGFIYRI